MHIIPIRFLACIRLVTGCLLGLSSSTALCQLPVPVYRSLQGPTLEGWIVDKGDGGTATTITCEDIRTSHYIASSSLTANVRRRKDIQAHNITFRRVRGDEKALFAHHVGSYDFWFDSSQGRPAGGTVEGGLFVWDSKKQLRQTQLDHGVAFQWIVDPRNPDCLNYGDIRVWLTPKDNPKGDWSKAVGNVTPERDARYRVVFQLPLQPALFQPTRRAEISLYKYARGFGTRNPSWILIYSFNPEIAEEEKEPSFDGGYTDARLQAEVISIAPNPGSCGTPEPFPKVGFRGTHFSVSFANWSWLWQANYPLPSVGNARMQPPTQAIKSPEAYLDLDSDTPSGMCTLKADEAPQTISARERVWVYGRGVDPEDKVKSVRILATELGSLPWQVSERLLAEFVDNPQQPMLAERSIRAIYDAGTLVKTMGPGGVLPWSYRPKKVIFRVEVENFAQTGTSAGWQKSVSGFGVVNITK